MEKIKKKAASLLQKCEVVVLSSINAEGYPRPVPIARIAIRRIIHYLDVYRCFITENNGIPCKRESRTMLVFRR